MAGNNLRGSFSGGSYASSFGGTSSQPLDSFFISPSSSSPSPSFLGSSSMVSFEDVCGGKRSERSFFCKYDADENGDDEYDDYFHQPEKKRRLTTEQVHFLEKSFETENKLDPERKVQLAKELGLQPRQVAIWFQNRRARWKNKQLEKDFDTLQSSFNHLKADFDTLFKEKEKLLAEVVLLTDKLHEKEKSKVHNMEPESNTHNQPWKKHKVEPNVDSTSESADDSPPKQHEDLNSAKSDDVLDSDNSHRTEPHDSSFAFEADHSDISQDDEDYLSNSLMPFSHVFTKIGGVNCLDPQAQSSNYGVSGDENAASLFWPYWDINLKM